MTQEVMQVAAAGFLHDIGTFVQYINESSEIMDKGCFASLATKYSLNELSDKGHFIELASQISAGMAQAEKISPNDFINTRMGSIFEEIGGSLTEHNSHRYRYELDELSAKSIFPVKKENREKGYKNIAAGFKAEVETIKEMPLDQWLKSFDEKCKKWFSFVPAVTSKGVLPDISLYDYVRTTSALAQALYVYHTQTNTPLNPTDGIDNTTKKLLYFKAKFNGIQNFIFSMGGETNKNAARILRGRSFYVSLLMKRATDLLCEQLGIAHTAVIINAAGAITAILPNTDTCKETLEKVKEQINEWLFKQFYGEVSVSFAYIEITADQFTHKLPEVGLQIVQQLEEAKFKKLPLNKLGVIGEYFKDGQTPCPYCGKCPSRDDNPCPICQDLIDIGKKIYQKEPCDLSAAIFGKYDRVESGDYDDLYIPLTENGEVKTLDAIADGDGKGIAALGVLKADVDNLGSLFREVGEKGGISKQVTMSRLLDAFWTVWLPQYLKENHPNIYTVFSGGDDLFLIGNWEDIISLALELKDVFDAFTCRNKKIHFSAGIAFLKAGEPIRNFYEFSEEALEKSKNYKNGDKVKNAFTLFGETISWEKKDDLEKCYEYIEKLIAEDKLNSGAIYKIMHFMDMAKKADGITNHEYDKVTYADMQAFKWKALLAYFIARNEKLEKDASKQEIIDYFVEKIENESQRSILKTMLWRNIYKNRERRK